MPGFYTRARYIRDSLLSRSQGQPGLYESVYLGILPVIHARIRDDSSPVSVCKLVHPATIHSYRHGYHKSLFYQILKCRVDV